MGELEPPIFRQISQWMTNNSKPIYYMKDINGALGLRGLPNGRYWEANCQAARMNGVEQRPGKIRTPMEPEIFERVCQSAAIIRGIQAIGEKSFEQFVDEVDQFTASKDDFSIKDVVRVSGRQGLNTPQRARVREIIAATPGEMTHPPYFSRALFKTICFELGPVRSALSPAERPRPRRNEKRIQPQGEDESSFNSNEYFVLGLGIRALNNRRLLSEIGIVSLNPAEMKVVNEAADGFVKLVREQNLDMDQEIRNRLKSIVGKLPLLFTSPQQFLEACDPEKKTLLQILLRAKQASKSVEEVSEALEKAILI